MFHHFHDEKNYIKGAGSITSSSFEEIINYIQAKYNIINCDEYIKKATKHPGFAARCRGRLSHGLLLHQLWSGWALD